MVMMGEGDEKEEGEELSFFETELAFNLDPQEVA